jgi:hypothetical protein
MDTNRHEIFSAIIATALCRRGENVPQQNEAATA